VLGRSEAKGAPGGGCNGSWRTAADAAPGEVAPYCPLDADCCPLYVRVQFSHCDFLLTPGNFKFKLKEAVAL
jgi:hypothetical protein